MKPLGFQLEEMRDLLAILDPQPEAPELDDPEARLAEFSATAENACEDLRAKLRIAEEFAAMLELVSTLVGRAPRWEGPGADNVLQTVHSGRQ